VDNWGKETGKYESRSRSEHPDNVYTTALYTTLPLSHRFIPSDFASIFDFYGLCIHTEGCTYPFTSFYGVIDRVAHTIWPDAIHDQRLAHTHILTEHLLVFLAYFFLFQDCS